ncbi:TipC family immunity protein [Gemella sanguinis]|uniref:TipC family immunity protein n=1 Tax=Gemella sanguinis TaxID=84135 RepID=UPI00352C67AE
MDFEKFKYHSIINDELGLRIVWDRGKEHFSYFVNEELAEKSRKSDKDALEVMFYLENKRWPKEDELENYNKTDVKEYIGDHFIVYEENGKYEIRIEKDYGGPVFYPITKELKERVFKSPDDANKVISYLESGVWPSDDPNKSTREFLRKRPEFIFYDYEENKKIFSEEEFNRLVELGKERKKQKEQEKEEIRENPELILWVSEKKRNMFSEEEINRLEVLAKEKIKVRKKKIRKRCGIFIAIIAIMIGSFYSYYKVNNRNAFEEMYNSYFKKLPLSAIDNMPQVKPVRRDDQGFDVKKLYYKEQVNGSDTEFSLINFDNEKKIFIISSTLIGEGVYLDINYVYDMNIHKLENSITFRGENVPLTEDKPKQRRELLQKYNVSKEYLQKKSDELLDTVLTDWKRYSNSSYSKDNMGRLTIEKDEFLK